MSPYNSPSTGSIGQSYLERRKLRREAIGYFLESIFIALLSFIYGTLFLTCFFFGFLFFEDLSGFKKITILACTNLLLFSFFYSLLEISMILIEKAKYKWRNSGRVICSPFH